MLIILSRLFKLLKTIGFELSIVAMYTTCSPRILGDIQEPFVIFIKICTFVKIPTTNPINLRKMYRRPVHLFKRIIICKYSNKFFL